MQAKFSAVVLAGGIIVEQHAGVVTRKESVTSDITNTKNPQRF
jgi:hypothetical protein